jgi:hypothetical protein
LVSILVLRSGGRVPEFAASTARAGIARRRYCGQVRIRQFDCCDGWDKFALSCET